MLLREEPAGGSGRTAAATESSQRDRERESPPRLERAIAAAQERLLRQQNQDGHWCAELEGDNILESEYVMLLYFLGRGGSEKVKRACAYLRRCQQPHGGWSVFPGGPPNPNPSVKSYFALKLAGDDPNAPHMRRARETILELGGVEACNSFTKIFLAVFGQYSWWRAPAVPPELMRLPLCCPINLWEMSSWSRAIVVPLSIVWALKPSCVVPPGRGIEELQRAHPAELARPALPLRNRLWAAFFRAVDRAVKTAEYLGLLQPWRRGSIELAKAFIEPRLEKSAGLAAIVPAILNTVLAYRALGGDDEHPVVMSQLAELERLEIDDGETLRLQPCCSPVWDTALTMGALLDAGLPGEDPRLLAAARWLLDREVTEPGDWRVKNPEAPIGGWFFEYANEFYPDCDDTAEVLAVLPRVHFPSRAEERRKNEALERAMGWQLAMQNRDGGWGAFDRDCDRELLTLIPFADHNAMIDPSTPDVTGRTVDGLRAMRLTRESRAVLRALDYLERAQDGDGAWYGRWGSNYIYGTWLAIGAFAAVGGRAFSGGGLGTERCEASRRGVSWLLSHQNGDGGWGETLLSYDDPRLKGIGTSTASQTSWAMVALLRAGAFLEAAGGEGGDDLRRRAQGALSRAAEYLLASQRDDGSWWDATWTGTGFPRVFYLRYHAYACYFPLQALANYRDALARCVSSGMAHSEAAEEVA